MSTKAGKAILGEKLGMTQIFASDGRAVPVTVIKAGPCVVTQVRSPERDGYSAVQLGFGERKPSKVGKPQAGHFKKANVEPRRHLFEYRTADLGDLKAGSEITAALFEPGERVDVIGVSKGRGFAGAMKRHGFHGLRATHGTERKHRSPGSVGAGTTPGRVFRGQKMPGRMGHERVTVLGLEVVESDAERHLLLIKGAVPGPVGGVVMVRNAVKVKS